MRLLPLLSGEAQQAAPQPSPRRWLQPEIRSAAGVMEQVVLDWFLGTMPPALQSQGRRNPGRGSPRPMPRPHAGGETGAGATKKASPLVWDPLPLTRGARASSTWHLTPFFSPPPPVPRLSDGPPRPTGSASDARTGVLAVRTTGPLPPRVPAHGGGAGGPGGWPAYLCSRFGGGVLHSGKGARE